MMHGIAVQFGWGGGGCGAEFHRGIPDVYRILFLDQSLKAHLQFRFVKLEVAVRRADILCQPINTENTNGKTAAGNAPISISQLHSR